MSEFINIYKNHISEKQQREIEFHLHKEDNSGGSQVRSCNFHAGAKMSKLRLPEKTGLKAKKGAMDVGLMWHEYLQRLFQNHFDNDPDAIAQGIHYKSEVYITVKMRCGITIISPIDGALVINKDGPGFIETEIEFKNGPQKVWVKHPDATWFRIIDIKSADNSFAYWHELESELLNIFHDGQMHVYMKGTGLTLLHVIFVNKGNGEMFIKDAKWNDDTWESVEQEIARKKELRDALNNDSDIEIDESDFILFNPDADDLECRYCELSVCEEDLSGKKPKLKLLKPCEASYQFIREQMLNKFSERQTWKRGRGHATIIKIDYALDLITVQLKNGNQYTDTFYFAWKVYEALDK